MLKPSTTKIMDAGFGLCTTLIFPDKTKKQCATYYINTTPMTEENGRRASRGINLIIMNSNGFNSQKEIDLIKSLIFGLPRHLNNLLHKHHSRSPNGNTYGWYKKALKIDLLKSSPNNKVLSCVWKNNNEWYFWNPPR